MSLPWHRAAAAWEVLRIALRCAVPPHPAAPVHAAFTTWALACAFAGAQQAPQDGRRPAAPAPTRQQVKRRLPPPPPCQLPAGAAHAARATCKERRRLHATARPREDNQGMGTGRKARPLARAVRVGPKAAPGMRRASDDPHGCPVLPATKWTDTPLPLAAVHERRAAAYHQPSRPPASVRKGPPPAPLHAPPPRQRLAAAGAKHVSVGQARQQGAEMSSRRRPHSAGTAREPQTHPRPLTTAQSARRGRKPTARPLFEEGGHTHRDGPTDVKLNAHSTAVHCTTALHRSAPRQRLPLHLGA